MGQLTFYVDTVHTIVELDFFFVSPWIGSRQETALQCLRMWWKVGLASCCMYAKPCPIYLRWRLIGLESSLDSKEGVFLLVGPYLPQLLPKRESWSGGRFCYDNTLSIPAKWKPINRQRECPRWCQLSTQSGQTATALMVSLAVLWTSGKRRDI